MTIITQFHLKEVPFFKILQSMHISNFTGCLDVSKAQLKKTIFFENGSIANAKSNDENDKMGEILIAHNKLHKKDLQKALSIQPPSVKLGTVLVKHNFIKPQDLIWVVKQQAYQIITSIFNWDEGKVDVIPEPLPNDLINLNINFAFIMLLGARSTSNPKIILNGIEQMEKTLYPSTISKSIIKKLQLSEKELTILNYIQNNKVSATEICQLRLYPPMETCKIIFTLLALNLVNH